MDPRPRDSDPWTARERVMLAAMAALFFVHVVVHAYHIVLRIPPPAQLRWSVIVPVWSSFGLLHAIYSLGWARTRWLLLVTLTVSFAGEYIGVKTGQPFGRYYYTDALGPKIAGTVPVIIPFAYFMMLYPSHVITNLVIDGTWASAERRLPGIVGASILTALVMTAWDLTTDPIMVDAVGAWVWVDGGPYFGIPLRNFAGWIVVVAGICLMYRLIEQRVPIAPLGRDARWITLGPLLGYGTMGLGDALVGVPEATRILPPFAMGTPLLAASMRLFEMRTYGARPAATVRQGREYGQPYPTSANESETAQTTLSAGSSRHSPE